MNVQCRKLQQSFIMTSSGTTPVQDVDEETTKMVQETINKIKSQGLFDQFRRDCLIDVDTKPAAQNLRQRVEGFVTRFLSNCQWSPNLNKNQLRDSLRKQINQSGMLTQGVERIIDQVVNPKIFQVIKPKIDEIVCSQLRLDYREWQAETTRRKAEALRIHQLQQQQKIQAVVNSIQQKQQQQQQQQQAANSASATAMSTVGAGFNIPPPGMFPGPDSTWQTAGGMFGGGLFPQMPFGNPYSFGVMGQQPLPPYMQGWGGGGVDIFPQLQQQLLQQATSTSQSATSTPALQPPPVQPIPPVQPPPPQQPPHVIPPPPSFAAIPAPATPAPPIAPPPGTIIPPPPLPSTVPPLLPDLSKPPPADIPMLPASSAGISSAHDISIPPPPLFGLSALPSIPSDPPPPGTELALPTIPMIPPVSGSPRVIPKVEQIVSSHSFLSPRLLAEAMIESPSPSKTAAKDNSGRKSGKLSQEKEVKKEESLETVSETKPSPTTTASTKTVRNLFGTDKLDETPACKKSEETATLQLLPAKDEKEMEKEVMQERLKDVEADVKESKRHYQFAWNKSDDEDDKHSDITISSVHTSDLSSFSHSSESSEEGEISDRDEEEVSKKDSEDVSCTITALSHKAVPSDKEVLPAKMRASSKTGAASDGKPRKLVALSYNYSDSEDEETREERKARLAKEKEERYLKRQARRAEMEVKRKEREEEKARMREKRKKFQPIELSASDEGTPVKDEKLYSVKSVQEEERGRTKVLESATSSSVMTSLVPTSTAQEEKQNSPRKKRRTKAEMKEELMQQKVEQRRAMRRQRTLNRRYASEEFTSIFSEKRELAPHLGICSQSLQEQDVVEETVEVDTTVDMDASGIIEQELVVGEFVVTTEPVEEETATVDVAISDLPSASGVIDVAYDSLPSNSKASVASSEKPSTQSSRASSPYSDISEETTTNSSSSSERSIRQRQRKQNSGDSSLSDQTPVKRSQRISSRQEEPSRGRTARSKPSEPHRASEASESRSRTSQRYDMDDLYKPRTNRRRPLTPPAADSSFSGRSERKVKHGTDTRRVDRRRDRDSPDRFSSKDKLLVGRSETRKQSYVPEENAGLSSAEHKNYAPRSTSQSGVMSPGRQSGAAGKPALQTPTATTPIIADMDLEPVSPEDESLDEVLDDAGDKSQSKEAESHNVTAENDQPSTDVLKAAAEEDGEGTARRWKGKVPIEMVDFGEAARHARGTGSGGGSSSSSLSGISSVVRGQYSVESDRRSARRPEGCAFAGGKYGASTSRLPSSSTSGPLSQAYSYDRNKMSWTAQVTASKPFPSQTSTENYQGRYDRSKMVWIAPGLKASNPPKASYDNSSDSGGGAQPGGTHQGRDEGKASSSRNSKESKSQASSEGHSPTRVQRQLYSPINDSSSSVLTDNSHSPTPPPLSPPAPSRSKRRHKSSSSSSSSSSSTSLSPEPLPQPAKRRRKESELSDGEITSSSSADSVSQSKKEPETNMVNLPKAYQLHNRSPSPDIKSSPEIVRCRTQSRSSLERQRKKKKSPPQQYACSHDSRSPSPQQERRRHQKMKRRHSSSSRESKESTGSWSGSLRGCWSKSSQEPGKRRKRARRQHLSSPEINSDRHSLSFPEQHRPQQSPSPPSLESVSDGFSSFPEDEGCSSPAKRIEIVEDNVLTPPTPGLMDERGSVTPPPVVRTGALPRLPRQDLLGSPVSPPTPDLQDERSREQTPVDFEERKFLPLLPQLHSQAEMDAFRGIYPSLSGNIGPEISKFPQPAEEKVDTNAAGVTVVDHAAQSIPSPHTPKGEQQPEANSSPSPPKLQAQRTPSDEWQPACTSSLTSVYALELPKLPLQSPQILGQGQGSPYPPPPDLSMENSPIPPLLEKCDDSPPFVQTHEDLQDGDTPLQLSEPSSQLFPPPSPLPLLQESPILPFVQQSEAVHEPQKLEECLTVGTLQSNNGKSEPLVLPHMPDGDLSPPISMPSPHITLSVSSSPTQLAVSSPQQDDEKENLLTSPSHQPPLVPSTTSSSPPTSSSQLPPSSVLLQPAPVPYSPASVSTSPPAHVSSLPPAPAYSPPACVSSSSTAPMSSSPPAHISSSPPATVSSSPPAPVPSSPPAPVSSSSPAHESSSPPATVPSSPPAPVSSSPPAHVSSSPPATVPSSPPAPVPSSPPAHVSSSPPAHVSSSPPAPVPSSPPAPVSSSPPAPMSLLPHAVSSNEELLPSSLASSAVTSFALPSGPCPPQPASWSLPPPQSATLAPLSVPSQLPSFSPKGVFSASPAPPSSELPLLASLSAESSTLPLSLPSSQLGSPTLLSPSHKLENGQKPLSDAGMASHTQVETPIEAAEMLPLEEKESKINSEPLLQMVNVQELPAEMGQSSESAGLFVATSLQVDLKETSKLSSVPAPPQSEMLIDAPISETPAIDWTSSETLSMTDTAAISELAPAEVLSITDTSSSKIQTNVELVPSKILSVSEPLPSNNSDESFTSEHSQQSSFLLSAKESPLPDTASSIPCTSVASQPSDHPSLSCCLPPVSLNQTEGGLESEEGEQCGIAPLKEFSHEGESTGGADLRNDSTDLEMFSSEMPSPAVSHPASPPSQVSSISPEIPQQLSSPEQIPAAPTTPPLPPPPPPPPRQTSPPSRRETRASSHNGAKLEPRHMVTRRHSNPPASPQRELRRNHPVSSLPVRETRSRHDKAPGGKRTKH